MILTGPNGYGKSTILKMVQAVCNNDLRKLLGYSFKVFKISYDDCELSIINEEEYFSVNNIKFEYDKGKFYRLNDLNEWRHKALYDEYFYIKRDIMKKYLDKKSDIVNISDEFYLDLIYKQIKNNDNSEAIKENLVKIKRILKDFQNSIVKVHFIEEQRLIEKRKIKKDDYLPVSDNI